MPRLDTRQTWLITVAVLLVLLVAFGVRVHLLDAQSLWHDEGNSYVQATRSLSAIADNAARDIHPPGYYWLLHLWRGLTGETEFALRSLSVFASVLSVAFTFALGKRLFGVWIGVISAAFVALNTFSIFYAQETRMYALLAMWASASMWVFVGLVMSPSPPYPRRHSDERHLRTQGRKATMPHSNKLPPLPLWERGIEGVRGYVLALGLLNAAGLYTQYAFPFVMIAQGVLFVLWIVRMLPERNYAAILRLLGWYIAANLLAILLYLPWLGTAWEQVTTWPNTGENIPTAQALSTILAWFSYGITREAGTTVTAAFFALFGVLNFTTESKRDGWRVLVPVVWVLLTVGAFLVLGLFREANLKFLLPAQIAFALWMAHSAQVLWTVQVRRQRIGVLRYAPKVAAVVGTLVIIGGLSGGLNPLYHADAYQRDDYRTIVAQINADPRPGDAIILSAPNQQEVFDYYYDGDLPIYPLPRGLGGDDAATLDETQQLITDHDRIFAVLWGTSERDPNSVVESTLDSQAFEASSAWYGDVRLVRYATPVTFDTVINVDAEFGEHITLESYALNADEFMVGDVLQLQLVWTTDAPLDTRYKVFVQLLDDTGFVVAQRDSEPGGNQRVTTSWTPDEQVVDNHAVIIPNSLTPANYSLIIGLYDWANPQDRLSVGDNDHLLVSDVVVLP